MILRIAGLALFLALTPATSHAQSVAACARIAAAGSLSDEQQRALGAEMATLVADLTSSNPAEADLIQECVAAALPTVVAGFQTTTTIAVGYIGEHHEVSDE